MNKFIINGISLTGKEIYGIHRNTIELLKALDKIIEPGVVEVVVPKNGECTDRLSFKNIKVAEVILSKHKGARFLWQHIGFLNYVRKHKGVSVDLTLGLSFLGSDLVCIYDCIREKFPDNAVKPYNKLSRFLYIKRVKKNIKSSRVILTDSESARNDIMEIYHVRDKEIRIVPCAWQHFLTIIPEESVLQRFELKKGEYFFSLGNRNMHKNFKWIAEAAKQNPQYMFVVSGTNRLGQSDAYLDREQTPNLIFTGYLQDGEIKALMKSCKAFIQPSLCEGFGIPPMEAMSTGARCIVSNASALPEVYQDSVWYIEPENYTDINMDAIMSQPIADNEEVLKQYSWDKSAKLFYDILMIFDG